MKIFGSLNEAHAYFTECQLATLVHMAALKRTPEGKLLRQRAICLNMLSWVDGDSAAATGMCPRVLELLKEAAKDPEGKKGALDREIARCKALRKSPARIPIHLPAVKAEAREV